MRMYSCACVPESFKLGLGRVNYRLRPERLHDSVGQGVLNISHGEE
jgi:hypothetical protein